MSTPPAQFSSLRAPPPVEIREPDAQSPIDFTKSLTPDDQPLDIIEFKGEKTGTHIVGLKDGVSMGEVIDDLFKAVKRDDAEIGAKWESINTFSGTFGPESLKFLCGSSRVSCIEESGYIRTLAVINQINAPWGLARLSTRDQLKRHDPTGTLNAPPSCLARDYIHRFNEQPGHGVDIYVVDTGVHKTHVELTGRVEWGKTITHQNGLPSIAHAKGGNNFHDRDYVGHGTHVAGIAAATRWGVAKSAHIIAVKVTNDAGECPVEYLIEGLEWVRAKVVGTASNLRRPSIVNLSMGLPGSIAVDKKVIEITNAGIHFVAAAGNEQNDARLCSPARVPSVICVGASNIHNRLWNESPEEDKPPNGSNFGHVVTLFAPGDNIISCGISDDHRIKPDALNDIPQIGDEVNDILSARSGTSQAAPHVSGLLAYLIGRGTEGFGGVEPTSPQVAKIKLLEIARKGVLRGVPAGTLNLLAYALPN